LPDNNRISQTPLSLGGAVFFVTGWKNVDFVHLHAAGNKLTFVLSPGRTVALPPVDRHVADRHVSPSSSPGVAGGEKTSLPPRSIVLRRRLSFGAADGPDDRTRHALEPSCPAISGMTGHGAPIRKPDTTGHGASQSNAPG